MVRAGGRERDWPGPGNTRDAAWGNKMTEAGRNEVTWLGAKIWHGQWGGKAGEEAAQSKGRQFVGA